MSDVPSRNPIAQRLQVLLSGGGYNFYDKANLARADDLLVRQRASAALADAAQALRTLEGDCRRCWVPAATRENPFPPPDAMEKLRQITRLGERIGGLESSIRGMAVPTQDKFWWRFRQEVSLLNELILFDHNLLEQAGEIARLAQELTPEQWQAGGAPPPLTAALTQLEQTIRDRQQLLLQPGL